MEFIKRIFCKKKSKDVDDSNMHELKPLCETFKMPEDNKEVIINIDFGNYIKIEGVAIDELNIKDPVYVNYYLDIHKSYSLFEYQHNLVENCPTKNHLINVFLLSYYKNLILKLRPDDIHMAIQMVILSFLNNQCSHLMNNIDLSLKKELNKKNIFFELKLLGNICKIFLNKDIDENEFERILECNYTTSDPRTVFEKTKVILEEGNNYKKNKLFLNFGIPEVILDGTTKDWEILMNTFKYLKELFTDTELNKWFTHFYVIMKILLETKHNTNSDYINEMWKRAVIVLPNNASKNNLIGGWVNLFCPYDSDSKLLDLYNSFPEYNCLDYNYKIPEQINFPFETWYELLKKYSLSRSSDNLLGTEFWNTIIMPDNENNYHNIRYGCGFTNPVVIDKALIKTNIYSHYMKVANNLTLNIPNDYIKFDIFSP